MKLSGNTVLITGGASGLGFSLAKAFARQRSKVIICDISDEKIEEAKKQIPDLIGYKCDLMKREEQENLFRQVCQDFPDINIVINNAGVSLETDFSQDKISLEKIEREITTNFTAPARLTALFLPVFLKKEKTAIVNICSECGIRPFYPIPLYTGTKAAMVFFTEALRNRLHNQLKRKRHKMSLLIVEVYPPTLDTPMNARWKDVKKTNPDIVAERILKGLQKDKVIIWGKRGEVRVYHFITRWLIRIFRFPRKVVRSIKRLFRGERIAW